MLLFRAKNIVKESRKFELTRLKKKEKHFGRMATFWYGSVLSRCFLAPLGGYAVRHGLPHAASPRALVTGQAERGASG